MVLFFVTFAVSFAIIVASSHWIVESAVKVAEIFKLSKIAVGVIMLAIVASLPEVMIAVFSSFKNNIALSIGNVFGASLIDMTLVIGLMVMYGGTIILTRKDVLKMLQFLFIASIVPLFVLLRGEINIGLGVILLGLFAFYVWHLYRRESAEVKEVGIEVEKEVEEELKEEKGGLLKLPEQKPRAAPQAVTTKEKILLVTKLFGSVLLLVFAANFLVNSALEIAAFFAVGATFIGATVVAFGTALPELSISVRAAAKGEHSLALADVFGASITDLTLVLGTASLLGGLIGAGKIVISGLANITTALPFLIISVVTVWYLLSEYGKISMIPGLALMALYLGFLMEITGFSIVFSTFGII